MHGEKDSEFLYVNKRRYLTTSLIFISIYILTIIILHDFPEIIYSIVTVIYLIGSFCVLLLIKSTCEVHKDKVLRIVCIQYIFIAIDNVIQLLPLDYETLYEEGIPVFSMQSSMSFFITMLGALLIIIYVNKKETNKIKVMTIAGSIFVILNIISFIVPSFIFSIIVNLMVISIFLNARTILKEYGTGDHEKVNYIYMAMCITLVLSIGFTIIDYIGIRNFYLQFSMIGIGFIVFTTQCIYIIEKLLNNPYKLLFGDLFNKNNEMNELNKKIVAKNRELELSQMVVRKKEKMLRTFFRNVPIPLVIINKENERVSFANTNFMELIGEGMLKKVINRKLFSIIQLESNSDFQESYSSLLRGTTEINGDLKYFDLEFVDVSENNDEVIVIFNDVTSKVKIDSMKESIQNKLFEERLKNDFLSNISHDLKTPINVIYSATQLIEFYISDRNSKSLERYNLISKLNCITLIRLTNNLIDSSRIYSDFLSANLEVKNIVEIIEEMTISLVDYAKNKNIDLVFDTNEEEIFVEVDVDFMQRIIINLISNAIKFSYNHGRIGVIVKDIGDEVIVSVKDNGMGMEKEFIKEAFGRYSMGNNNRQAIEKGTGIGLFVVKKLVEKQNGKISVESEIDIGSNFELLFKKVI
ncbi:sensor histidine kinase [Clostridium paraputrificum]|uniref:sensor histidine kinase n=1 Tax=Clostridium paraputrificum TaxID=29363 RepID=UPI003D3297DD